MRVAKTGLIAVFGFSIVLVIGFSIFKDSLFPFESCHKEEDIQMIIKASNLMTQLIKSKAFVQNSSRQVEHKALQYGADGGHFQNGIKELIHSPPPPVVEIGLPLIDRRVAENVGKKVRVLCWIPTRAIFKDTRLRAVNSTWVKRCDKVLYIVSQSRIKLSDTIVVSIPDHRKTLNDKTVFTNKYIYQHYLNDFDWFLKADDNTYVIMENLKFLLSRFDTKTPGYIGCQHRHYSPQGYMNGGAGYVFNSLGIKTIVEQGYNIPGRCRLTGGAEDIETGRCANKAGVRTLNQMDVNDKNTFFSSSVTSYVLGPLPPWTLTSTRGKVLTGLDCCSPLVVSFHHTDEQLMFVMEYLLYKVLVHGRAEIFNKSEGLFSGKEAVGIPRSMGRRAYPGENLDEYYAPGWREKNTPVLHNPWLQSHQRAIAADIKV